MSNDRVSVLCSHLRPQATSATSSQQQGSEEEVISGAKALDMMLPNKIEMENKWYIKDLVPGPLDDHTPDELQAESQRYVVEGQNMLLVEKWTKQYKSLNILQPATFMTYPKRGAYKDWLVTIGHPEDVERILKNHAKKSDFYGFAFLGDGVLSTRDNALWQEQRKHLADAFLPNSTLSTEVFPRSLARAQFAAEKRMPEFLKQQAPNGVVEMNDFLLHEAMAQLQTALIGETDEDMEKTNVPLRRAHEDNLTIKAEPIDVSLKRRAESKKVILSYSKEVLSHCPQGALGKRLVDNCPFGKDDAKIKRDTVSTFNFAGYDTTGNLMTWALYQMCKHTQYQDRVRAEIDALFDGELKHRPMEYKDLLKLPFLSRVLTETLRLFPSVPNGTYRELEHDEQIHGRDGKMVTLPKGTQLNIPVWLLHTSEELWGPTVEEFNPERDFLPAEVWNGLPLAGWNPSSHRYQPFTAGPRDCLGKNFAQMEARLVLIYQLRHYKFSLAEPTLSASKRDRERNKNFIAYNTGTMGPKNGIHLNVEPRF